MKRWEKALKGCREGKLRVIIVKAAEARPAKVSTRTNHDRRGR
jgi:hypothetical protein